MTFKPALLATIVVAVLASGADAQTALQQPQDKPDFRVQVWGVATADFDTRMTSYAALRDRLQQGLPPLELTDNPADIRRAEYALAKRIRAARAGAHGGEIFTAEITAAFKDALILQARPSICAAILDDNPGDFSYDINDTYPARRPLSTVPAGILMLLPRLPADVYYRFLGRELILHDTRANVILDRIPNAIRCHLSYDQKQTARSRRRCSRSVCGFSGVGG